MRMRPSPFLLCLPLLAACPGDDGPATTTSAATSTTGELTTTGASSTSTAGDTTETTTASPPDTDTDTETDTDTSGTVPGCECIVDESPVDQTDAPSWPTCGESLCGSVSGSCEGYCLDDSPFMLDDPAALECALVALRDRTPGRVSWSWFENGGQYDDTGYVLVNADGSAVRRDWGWSDFDYSVSDAVLGQLPPSEHFDACLAEPDDLLRFDCLRGPLDSMTASCDEGWFYTDF